MKNNFAQQPDKFKKEELAGFIVFSVDEKKITRYLILRKYKGFYEFPKGHVDRGEDLLKAATRELAEETGLTKVEQIPGFSEKFNYSFRREDQMIYSTMTLFLGKADQQVIALSREHIESHWLPFEQALTKLTFKNAREVLRKANQFLENNQKPDGN